MPSDNENQHSFEASASAPDSGPHHKQPSTSAEAEPFIAEHKRDQKMRWRRWLVLFGGFLVHLTLGNMYTVGNITTYLTSYVRVKVDPTFTYEDAGWIYSATMVGRGLFTTLGGYLELKFGPRIAALVGCAFATFGIWTTAYSIDISPWLAVFTHGFLFGIGIGFAFTAPMMCAMKWFPGQKGLVTGIVLGGFGLGALIFNQIQTAVLNPDNKAVDKETGYFSDEEILGRVPFVFQLLALVHAVMQLIGCALLVDPPPKEDQDIQIKPTAASDNQPTSTVDEKNANEQPLDSDNGTPTDTETKEKDLEANSVSKGIPADSALSPMEILKTKEFYMLWFTFLFNQQAVGYITTMYKAFGQTFISNDQLLSIVGSISSIFNFLGRIFWGALSDRTSYKTSMLLVTSLLTVLFTTFGVSQYGGEAVYTIYVVVIFFVFSGTFVLMPTATCQTFGQKYSGPNYGLIFTSAIAGPPLQSFLASYLSDKIGTWGLLFMTAGFAAVAFLITIGFDRSPGPQKIRERWTLKQ